MVDPEVIILSGGMTQAGESFRLRIEESILANSWKVLPTNIRVVLSTSSEDNGIIGSAIAAKEYVKNK